MTPTPIFDAVTDEWLDAHDNRPPGDYPDPEKVEPVATPLLDDVEVHGTGPWDAPRREMLSKHLNWAPTPVPKAPRPRKPAKPRQPRGRR